MVGVAGFEPTASASRTQRAAKLRYTPMELCDSRNTGSLADAATAPERAERTPPISGRRPVSAGSPPAGRRTVLARTGTCRARRRRSTTCRHSAIAPWPERGRVRSW
jgi:hypothetical protein